MLKIIKSSELRQIRERSVSLFTENEELIKKNQALLATLSTKNKEIERLEARIKEILEKKANKAIEAKKKWLNAYPDEDITGN